MRIAEVTKAGNEYRIDLYLENAETSHAHIVVKTVDEVPLAVYTLQDVSCVKWMVNEKCPEFVGMERL